MRTDDELRVAATTRTEQFMHEVNLNEFTVFQSCRDHGAVSRADFMLEVRHKLYIQERIKDRIADLIAGGL